MNHPPLRFSNGHHPGKSNGLPFRDRWITENMQAPPAEDLNIRGWCVFQSRIPTLTALDPSTFGVPQDSYVFSMGAKMTINLGSRYITILYPNFKSPVYHMIRVHYAALDSEKARHGPPGIGGIPQPGPPTPGGLTVGFGYEKLATMSAAWQIKIQQDWLLRNADQVEQTPQVQ